MPTVRSNPVTLFFIAFLLIATAPSPSHSLSLPFSPFFLYRNLFSLAHSILTAVAYLRASRGDLAGAARARAIAEKLERGLGFGFWSRVLWSAAWNLRELSDMTEMLRALSELSRLESGAERLAWVSQNYQNALELFKSRSRELLKTLGQSGVLREVVETVQIEVVEGVFIRDCLELGSNDLKALVQIAKDLVLQFFPPSNKDPELQPASNSDL